MTSKHDNIHSYQSTKYRFRDILLGEFALADDGESGSGSDNECRSSIDGANTPPVKVEYYINEKTLKERIHLYFVRNQRSSLRIRLFNLFIKLLTCVLYVIRVVLDEGPQYATCYDCSPRVLNVTEDTSDEDKTSFSNIDWNAILWVNRHVALWSIQVAVAIISLTETVILIFIGYKGSLSQQILTFNVFLEIINSVPFIVTIFWAPLRNLFIPVFFNCWLAKRILESMFHDFHRAMQKSQSALSQQLMILSATLLCLVFTTVCGLQHLQRGGHNHLSIFSSFYCVVVTFSTVGYGDIKPDIWPSQLFMVIMICVALIVLPTQFERLAFTWMERKKLGGSYSIHRTQNEKHVVVCCTCLQADTIMDFLNEFYAHPRLQDFFVVLLSPCEIDSMMKMILQRPLWTQRVIYIQGSALKDADLTRARMNNASACFILAARNYKDKTAADEHTVLRSWAVKDFAPTVPQYVQVFRPENKMHVRFAEHVVCEDEFKYALLANNCMSPGTSTLVTLLLHTSRGQEGQSSPEEWQRLYGRCSGNEIYHIVLGDSRFFGEFKGKSFTYASFHAHRKYGVALLGIQSTTDEHRHGNTRNSQWSIMLNPGPQYKLITTDICFYMSLTKEENSAFIQSTNREDSKESSEEKSILRKLGSTVIPAKDNDGGYLNIPSSARHRERRPSILPVPAFLNNGDDNIVEEKNKITTVMTTVLSADILPTYTDTENPDIMKGFPPVSPYIGASPTLCYLLKIKKQLCCLQLAQTCDHCSHISAKDYNWSTRAIILAADYAGYAIYNFVVPLRAHTRSLQQLNPVVLLLERQPDLAFLDAISHFPLVYWMIGSIDSVDDLLKAGINLAGYVVVVNKESSNSAEEDYLADCNTIVAVQTMFKLFPNVRVITELSQSSNMRFMQFKADDAYAVHLSKIEKKEKERGSHISYMFRLPFAAGSVFSASMLDTLLYQAFVKDYMIPFVRLLLGIDQAPFSGSLISMQIGSQDMWIRTYGRLYQKLCSTTSEIPIGIYRTQRSDSLETNEVTTSRVTEDWTLIETQEVENLIKCRMESLGLPFEEYGSISEKGNSLSYVVINPSCDLKLEEGDIIYLIRPAPLSTKKIFLNQSSMKYSMSMKRQKQRKQSTKRNPATPQLDGVSSKESDHTKHQLSYVDAPADQWSIDIEDEETATSNVTTEV